MAEANDTVPREFRDRTQQIIDRLDVFHREMRDIEKRIEQVGQLADRVQLPRVHFAARDAFTKISNAGTKLVECHLTLAHILTPRRDDTMSGGHEHD